jgi:hypothetical protein
MKYDWFQKLFGFEEPTRSVFLKQGYSLIHSKFSSDPSRGILTRLSDEGFPQEKVFHVGTFTTPTVMSLQEQLKELKRKCDVTVKDLTKNNQQAGATTDSFKFIDFEHIKIDGVLEIHAKYPNAVFQAASQFNCLEFPSFHVIPEDGITAYYSDHTQGPACALACAAGTLYRNYFVSPEQLQAPSSLPEMNQSESQCSIGQTASSQVNNLAELESFLDNASNNYWEIRNGYSFSNPERLDKLNAVFSNAFSKDSLFRNSCVARMKVGYHRQVGVVFRDDDLPLEEDIRVTQVYCSALSCRYSGVPNNYWEQLARIVLEGMYEGTLLVGMIEMISYLLECKEKGIDLETIPRGNSFHNHVFLTFLGGGVFGNDMKWIADAIGRSAVKVNKAMEETFGSEMLNDLFQLKCKAGFPLQVKICHFRNISSATRKEIDDVIRNAMAK